jgi:hypothetical protein
MYRRILDYANLEEVLSPRLAKSAGETKLTPDNTVDLGDRILRSPEHEVGALPTRFCHFVFLTLHSSLSFYYIASCAFNNGRTDNALYYNRQS